MDSKKKSQNFQQRKIFRKWDVTGNVYWTSTSLTICLGEAVMKNMASHSSAQKQPIGDSLETSLRVQIIHYNWENDSSLASVKVKKGYVLNAGLLSPIFEPVEEDLMILASAEKINSEILPLLRSAQSNITNSG